MSNFYFDHRGDLIADYEPGGVAYKSVFDGVGRDAIDYVTDGGALNESGFNPLRPDYTVASSAASDVVLSQTERTFDGADNVIETIQRQRDHDDFTNATGPLGTFNSGVFARVYAAGSWYDAADRLIASADVGTDGGATWSRPSAAPTSSTDSLLLTLDAYGSNGQVSSMTDPRGVVTAYMTDALGRVTQSVVDPGGIGQTTNFTYDGLDHVLTRKAIDGTAHQTTQYNYAVGGAGGQLSSNDLLSSIQFPDKASGDPGTGAADQDLYTYDALGEAATFKDQNQTTHGYTYDSLGRLTLDGVTTFGSGVNGTVKSLGYAFDGAGRPFQQSSYNVATNPTPANTLNQVQDAYDGFGQMTAQYQAHVGAVNPSTTPAVKYSYTQAAGGQNDSRLTGVTYPNGRSVDDIYGAQLQLTNLTSSGTLATATVNGPLPTGLGVGAWVEIAGASPSTYDGEYAITGVVGSSFTFNLNSTPTVQSASGNDVTADLFGQVPIASMSSVISGSNTIVTVTTAMPYQLSSGANVTITGSAQSPFNGTFAITDVNATKFTYTVPGVQIAEASDSGKDLIAVTDAFASLDGAISRVTGLQDHGGSSVGQILEGYNYLGTSDIVIRNRPQNQTQLSYLQQLNDTLTSSDGGDKYTGMDRFGRVIDQNWLNLNPGATSPEDRFQYWYDRGGNVLYQNVVGQGTTAGTYSELFHGSGGLDSAGYDNLDRIVSFERGTLSHTNSNNVDPTGHNLMDTVATANKTQTWTLDAQGNWTKLATQGSADQNRTFNTRNQISTITGTSVTYDANGNVKIDDQGINYTYDAWNRLVTASKNGGFFEVYTYDADGRRPGLTISGGNVYDSYYSMDWQVLQDNLTPPGCGGTITQSQYVWGMGYVDDLIERDYNSDSNGSTGSLGITSSGLEQRLYAQQDANWNVTSLVDTTGAVKERFTYDPYGSALVLTGTWASTSQHLGTDTYGWIYGFQTGRYDPQTGLYNFRERDYSTTLGRFIEVDPILCGDGTNYYQFEQDDPVGHLDPLGLYTETRYMGPFFRYDPTTKGAILYYLKQTWQYPWDGTLFGTRANCSQRRADGIMIDQQRVDMPIRGLWGQQAMPGWIKSQIALAQSGAAVGGVPSYVQGQVQIAMTYLAEQEGIANSAQEYASFTMDTLLQEAGLYTFGGIVQLGACCGARDSSSTTSSRGNFALGSRDGVSRTSTTIV